MPAILADVVEPDSTYLLWDVWYATEWGLMPQVIRARTAADALRGFEFWNQFYKRQRGALKVVPSEHPDWWNDDCEGWGMESYQQAVGV